MIFDGRFAPEDGSPGRPPKATGNNITAPSPSESDWYETIKLNYGFNFVTGETAYNPQPQTWQDVDAILAYWQAKGVDGFRCDFAHYVPKEAWAFLIGNARQRRPAYFLAEAYPFAGSGDPIQSQEELIQAGFDAVYHYQAYNALKRIYLDGQMEILDRELVSQPARRSAAISSRTSRITTNGASHPQLFATKEQEQVGLVPRMPDTSWLRSSFFTEAVQHCFLMGRKSANREKASRDSVRMMDEQPSMTTGPCRSSRSG